MKAKKRNKESIAQATLEFTFAIVIAVLLLIGTIQVAVWSGKDLADRRMAHERYLVGNAKGWEQTKPTFYLSSPISATVPSNIFGNYLKK